jgi:hypothetical protein
MKKNAGWYKNIRLFAMKLHFEKQIAKLHPQQIWETSLTAADCETSVTS